MVVLLSVEWEHWWRMALLLWLWGLGSKSWSSDWNVCHGNGFTFTPWKLNMEPKHRGLEDEFSFQLGDFKFQVDCQGCRIAKKNSVVLYTASTVHLSHDTFGAQPWGPTTWKLPTAGQKVLLLSRLGAFWDKKSSLELKTPGRFKIGTWKWLSGSIWGSIC